MNRDPSRRLFLRGAGGATIALPLLEAMRPRMACAAGTPRRFIAVVTPNGTIPEHFWPTPPGSTPWPRNKATVPFFWKKARPAIDTSEHALSWITEPLAAHRQRMLFVEGVGMRTSGGHPGIATLLSGHRVDGSAGVERVTSLGPSMDQVIASAIGAKNRFPSLQVGVMTNVSHFGMVSFYGARKGAPAESSPPALFARLFGDAAGDGTSLERLRLQRRSVLDATRQQVSALLPRVSQADRSKLDNYLESLRAVERQLTEAATVTSRCVKPAAPTDATADWWKKLSLMPKTAKAQIDLLVMAMTCDLTRVATLQLAMEQSYYNFPFLDIRGAFHELSHKHESDVATTDELARIDRWHAEQVAYLLDRLAAAQDDGGSLLDGTYVLWTNPMDKGNLHSSDNLPVILAGGGPGPLRTGRYVRLAFDRRRSINDLHFEIQRALGLPVKTAGDPEFFTGGIPELRA